jgi:hypothetical protein
MIRFKCDHRCPYCIENRQGRAMHRGHRGFRVFLFSHLSSEAYMGMQRQSAGDNPNVGPVFVDNDFQRDFPTLYQWLTETKWDDGKQRKTTTLMLTVDDGTLKAWVHDRDGRRSAWVSGTTLDSVLEAVDGRLQDNRMEWRSDKR